MNLKQLLTSQVFYATLSSVKIDEKCIINTINPHSYCELKKDKIFKKALLKSDILLPDGFGIVLATKFITDRTIKKIAGADIHQFLLEKANLTKQKVFYLGASENALSLIEKRIQKEFPDIQVSSFSPPYKTELTENETKIMLAAVNTFNPNILFLV
jgi:N-acetylglucosaminyldiphosphoundecaprenol N-acetyl-beta-D-mannosaminyltransferase